MEDVVLPVIAEASIVNADGPEEGQAVDAGIAGSRASLLTEWIEGMRYERASFGLDCSKYVCRLEESVSSQLQSRVWASEFHSLGSLSRAPKPDPLSLRLQPISGMGMSALRKRQWQARNLHANLLARLPSFSQERRFACMSKKPWSTSPEQLTLLSAWIPNGDCRPDEEWVVSAHPSKLHLDSNAIQVSTSPLDDGLAYVLSSEHVLIARPNQPCWQESEEAIDAFESVYRYGLANNGRSLCISPHFAGEFVTLEGFTEQLCLRFRSVTAENSTYSTNIPLLRDCEYQPTNDLLATSWTQNPYCILASPARASLCLVDIRTSSCSLIPMRIDSNRDLFTVATSLACHARLEHLVAVAAFGPSSVLLFDMRKFPKPLHTTPLPPTMQDVPRIAFSNCRRAGYNLMSWASTLGSEDETEWLAVTGTGLEFVAVVPVKGGLDTPLTISRGSFNSLDHCTRFRPLVGCAMDAIQRTKHVDQLIFSLAANGIFTGHVARWTRDEDVVHSPYSFRGYYTHRIKEHKAPLKNSECAAPEQQLVKASSPTSEASIWLRTQRLEVAAVLEALELASLSDHPMNIDAARLGIIHAKTGGFEGPGDEDGPGNVICSELHNCPWDRVPEGVSRNLPIAVPQLDDEASDVCLRALRGEDLDAAAASVLKKTDREGLLLFVLSELRVKLPDNCQTGVSETAGSAKGWSITELVLICENVGRHSRRKRTRLAQTVEVAFWDDGAPVKRFERTTQGIRALVRALERVGLVEKLARQFGFPQRYVAKSLQPQVDEVASRSALTPWIANEPDEGAAILDGFRDVWHRFRSDRM